VSEFKLIKNNEHNYALVGLHDRRLWLVLDHAKVAHEIQQAFASKISFIVFDLKSFDSEFYSDISNDTCLNYAVDIREFIDQGIIKKIDYTIVEGIKHSTKKYPLLSVDNHKTITLIKIHEELKNQMIYFYKVRNIFYKQNAYFPVAVETVPDSDQDIANRNKIIAAFGLELHLPEIKQQLFSIAKQILDNHNETAKSLFWAATLLQLLDRYYE